MQFLFLNNCLQDTDSYQICFCFPRALFFEFSDQTILPTIGYSADSFLVVRFTRGFKRSRLHFLYLFHYCSTIKKKNDTLFLTQMIH